MKFFIRGRVVDPQGQPVEGASVYFVSGPGSQPDVAMLSEEDGSFALPGVSTAGTYRVGATAVGMSGEVEVIMGAESTTVEVKLQMRPCNP